MSPMEQLLLSVLQKCKIKMCSFFFQLVFFFLLFFNKACNPFFFFKKRKCVNTFTYSRNSVRL